MAKRKKTPEVLVGRRSQEHHPTSPPQESHPPVDQSPHPLGQAVVEPPADPFTALFPSQPVAAPAPFSTSTKLTVTAGEDIAHEVEQYVSQALRALPDVRLVQEEAEWTLIVLGVPIQSPNGKTYGIALSAVVTKTIDRQSQESGQSGALLPSASAPTTAPTRVAAFRGTWLRIGAHRRMQHLCEQLVADFQSRYLEPGRRRIRA